MPNRTTYAGEAAAHLHPSRLPLASEAGLEEKEFPRPHLSAEFAVPAWHVRSRSSQALLKTEVEEHYQRLWKFVSTGLMVIDNMGSVVSANAYARQLLKPGSCPTELLRLFSCVSSEDRARVTQFLSDVFEGHAPASIDVQIHGSEAVSKRHVRLSFVAIATLTAALTVHDITEIKQLEAAKLLAEAKLDQVQRLELVHTLSAGMAHDFKNIVQVIESYAAVLMGQTTDGEQANSIAQEIMAAAERGAGLAHRWLAYSRHGELQKQKVEVAAFVNRCMATIGRELPKTIQVQTRCDSESLTCRLDPCLIEQVLFNLCLNARDAMPAGGTIQVNVQRVSFDSQASSHDLLPAGDYAKISIADDGTGISAEIIERIFEPFFTTKATTVGTGLGLALVRGIVSEHEGAIEVSSEVGIGSVFTVYLPSQNG